MLSKHQVPSDKMSNQRHVLCLQTREKGHKDILRDSDQKAGIDQAARYFHISVSSFHSKPANQVYFDGFIPHHVGRMQRLNARLFAFCATYASFIG